MDKRMLKRKEVLKIVSISHATVYRLMKDGRFPKQRPLSKSRVGWLEEDIHEFLEVGPDGWKERMDNNSQGKESA